MTSHTELIEELQVAIDDLRALHVAKKNDMESITGFSADAIATLYEASRDRISSLTVEVEELRAKFASFASHATGGRTSDISLPLNTLSVMATQKVNDAWNAALEKGREEARATLTKADLPPDLPLYLEYLEAQPDMAFYTWAKLPKVARTAKAGGGDQC
jgi:hypothetical protein